MLNNIELIILNFEAFFINYAYIIFPSVIIGVVLFVGLSLLIYSFINEYIYTNRLKTNLIVTGKIKDIKTTDSRNCTMYTAIIEYELDGTLFKHESDYSSTSCPEIGKDVILLCNPLDFNDVVEKDLKAFLFYRFVGIIFTVLPLIFILIFVVTYFQQDCHNLQELFYYLQNNN